MLNQGCNTHTYQRIFFPSLPFSHLLFFGCNFSPYPGASRENGSFSFHPNYQTGSEIERERERKRDEGVEELFRLVWTDSNFHLRCAIDVSALPSLFLPPPVRGGRSGLYSHFVWLNTHTHTTSAALPLVFLFETFRFCFYYKKYLRTIEFFLFCCCKTVTARECFQIGRVALS